ncbi:hypothetical protein Golax_002316 [Gossypium laxum]|uniref:Uncharacterized protein n=1 Tax=Gossypium laxum TaxID=34288 RepID=A0A7J9ARE7_9ROSI|nr:hypothetical protein [Gossypium laxum]
MLTMTYLNKMRKKMPIMINPQSKLEGLQDCLVKLKNYAMQLTI